MKYTHTKRTIASLSIVAITILISSFFTISKSALAEEFAPYCDSVLSKNLKWGDRDPEVIVLQKILNADPETRVKPTAGGSIGHETSYFGNNTYFAVIKFQEKYASEILTPAGFSKPTGMVATSTRTKIADMCTTETSELPQSIDTSSEGLLTASLYDAVNLEKGTTVSSRQSLNWGQIRRNKETATTTSTSTASTTPTEPIITSTSTPTTTPTVQPISTTTASTTSLLWGAYVGNDTTDLLNFETLVGKKTNIFANFQAFGNAFPFYLTTNVGKQGKTLLIYWEPHMGYDQINNGSQDAYILQFAKDAQLYGYPVILAPFIEMNLNETPWGYGVNGNTPEKFQTAWKRMHNLFAGVTNVKFAIGYNNVSVPNVVGNRYVDYYPGDAYVDFVGVDGFNFNNPWKTFSQTFDMAMAEAGVFNKPVYILSTASAAGTEKAAWITELGSHSPTYQHFAGWVWFNLNKEQNWLVNSDPESLQAFKSILP
ncbi:MAG: hypothetical protein M3Q80_01770 [bacterium]|nr:hypothetical protein [bacterium]